MATKKITDLSAATSVSSDDLMLVVDMAGPTTYKITVANFFSSITANATFAANVALQGTTTANTLTATGNVTFNTAGFVTANNVIIKKSTTPSSSTDGANSSLVGLMWTDANYIYVQANATYIKRVSLSSF